VEAGTGDQARATEDTGVVVKLDRALDRYMGALARKGYSPATRRSYWFKLIKLCDDFENVEDGAGLLRVLPLAEWSRQSSTSEIRGPLAARGAGPRRRVSGRVAVPRSRAQARISRLAS